MTDRRTCLRCDWQGETNATTCPNCAAPLYELRKQPSEGAGAEVRSHPEERSREAASTARVAPSAAPPRPSSPPPPSTHEAAPQPQRPRRSRSLVAIVVAVIVLAVAVGAWLNAHEAPTEAAAPQTPETQPEPPLLTGSLVYAVPDGAGHSRLWRYDLETETATPGPRVRRAIELIDARSVDHTWLGPHVRAPQRARCRRPSCAPSAPTPGRRRLLEGDVVSWGPQGRTVIAGRRGALGIGCRRSVSIVWARLVPAAARAEVRRPLALRRPALDRDRQPPARCSRWIGTVASGSSSPGSDGSIGCSTATRWSPSRRCRT